MSFFPFDLATVAPPPRPRVEWEEVPCLLCGGRQWSTLVEAPDAAPGGSGLWFAVVQCHDCGLCFTNPRPSAATLGQFYPPAYGPHRVAEHGPGRRRLAWPWRYDERDGVPVHGGGRLLDFGCGGGSYLVRMKRQGWQVTGLDVSTATVERARTRLGVRTLAGTLPHPALGPGSFDLITMWHALEHVHQPQAVLREAHRLLAPGGRLLVAVPNIDSLPFRWFGHAWFGLDLPRHLTHFAPPTLELMLVRAGFRPGRVRMVRHGKWLRASAALACRHAAGPRWHRWCTRKPVARLAAWYSYLTQQSDCMMVTAWR